MLLLLQAVILAWLDGFPLLEWPSGTCWLQDYAVSSSCTSQTVTKLSTTGNLYVPRNTPTPYYLSLCIFLYSSITCCTGGDFRRGSTRLPTPSGRTATSCYTCSPCNSPSRHTRTTRLVPCVLYGSYLPSSHPPRPLKMFW